MLYAIIRQLKNYRKELLLFGRTPYAINENDLNEKRLYPVLKKLLFFLLLYLEVLFVSGMLIAIIMLISAQSGIAILENIAPGFKTLGKLSVWEYLVLAGIIGPVYEELIFRNYLRLNKNNLAMSISVGAFILSGPTLYPEIVFDMKLILKLSGAGMVFFLVRALMKNKWIEIIRDRYYKYVFYFSVVIFGYFHIFNFSPLNFFIIVFSPFFLLPQLFMGLIGGYIRIREGLRWSVALHSLINIMAVGLQFFVQWLIVEV